MGPASAAAITPSPPCPLPPLAVLPGPLCGGVAAGFADYLDVDPVLVRLGFVLLTFASGVGFVFYVVCWVIMPTNEQDVTSDTSPSENFGDEVRAAGERVANEVREARDSGRGRMIGGVVLLVLGSMFLLDRFSWMFYWPHWLRMGNLWPLILVAIGLALIMRSREERA